MELLRSNAEFLMMQWIKHQQTEVVGRKITLKKYEQTERRLSYFYPNGIVESDGILTQALNLYFDQIQFTVVLCFLIFVLCNHLF